MSHGAIPRQTKGQQYVVSQQLRSLVTLPEHLKSNTTKSFIINQYDIGKGGCPASAVRLVAY